MLTIPQKVGEHRLKIRKKRVSKEYIADISKEDWIYLLLLF